MVKRSLHGSRELVGYSKSIERSIEKKLLTRVDALLPLEFRSKVCLIGGEREVQYPRGVSSLDELFRVILLQTPLCASV